MFLLSSGGTDRDPAQAPAKGPGTGQEGPRPADQTASMAGASGGGRSAELYRCSHQLGRAHGLAGRAPAGQPLAGRRGAPACVPAESERGAEHGASSTHSGRTPLPPRHPGATPDTASRPGSRPGPRPTHQALRSPAHRGTSTHGGRGRGRPRTLQPSPASVLQMAHSGAWRALPLLRPPCRKELQRAPPGREPFHPWGSSATSRSGGGGEPATAPAALPPSCPSCLSPFCLPRAKSSPFYRRRN